MSRVAKFRAAHPDIQLRLVASAPARDLTASGIDLAVCYGRGQWPGVEALHLLDNHVFPVCAPAYMARRRPLQSVTDLLEETLLDLVEYDRNWVTWEAWLAAMGVTAPPRGPSLEFDNSLVLTQAALDGQDIALGGGRLAEDFLARDVLIRPIEAMLRFEQSFYLLIPNDQPLTPRAKAFHDWILVEAKEKTG